MNTSSLSLYWCCNSIKTQTGKISTTFEPAFAIPTVSQEFCENDWLSQVSFFLLTFLVMKGIRQEQALIGELKFSHKRWVCWQKYHQFLGKQVKYSLISLMSGDCATTLGQGQPMLPSLGVRPVEMCGRKWQTELKNSSASLRHAAACLALFQTPNQLYFRFYSLTFTRGKKIHK